MVTEISKCCHSFVSSTAFLEIIYGVFSPQESGEYQRVVAFLKGIPQDVLAKAALRSKAYTRALMHFEAYILEIKENIQDHLTFLQVIKIALVKIFQLFGNIHDLIFK